MQSPWVSLGITTYLESKASDISSKLKVSLVNAIDDYHRVGITTVGVMGTQGVIDDPVLGKAALDNKLRMALFINGEVPFKSSPDYASTFPIPKVKDTVKRCNIAVRQFAGERWVNCIGTKFWYDGSPYSGSMFINDTDGQRYKNNWLTQQLGIYEHDTDSENKYGHQTYNPALYDFKVAVQNALKEGMVAVHTQGSQAAQDVLNIYIKSCSHNDQAKDTDTRINCRLEHNAFLSTDNIKNAAVSTIQKNLHLSFHVLHMYWYGRILGGKEPLDTEYPLLNRKVTSILPLKTASESGISMSFHTDSPMYPPDPLLTVQSAITRIPFQTGTQKKPVSPESEVLGIGPAMQAITIHAAKGLNMEDRVGKLAKGYYGDIVVLDKDPFAVEKYTLHEKVNIKKVYVGGELVFSKE